MSVTEIIAQVLNCFGSITCMIGINLKDKRKFLLCIIITDIIIAISLGLLNAKSGMLAQIIFALESFINYLWEKKSDKKYPIWLVIIYIILPTVVLAFSYQSVWDILPMIAGIVFPLALVSHNLTLRILNLISVVVWIPYNFYFGQYVGTVSCSILTIINVLAIIRLDVLKRKVNINENN